MRRIFKALGVMVGIAVAAILLLLGALMIDWARPASRVEEDHLVAQARSPDQKFVAEIRRYTAAMHGGPDKLYVALGEVGLSPGDKVYERTYECDDLSAFRLQWATTHELVFTYSDCNAEPERSKGKYSDFDYKQQNRVWQSYGTWRDVKITYEDSKCVAKR
jgi:hypothetical protein